MVTHTTFPSDNALCFRNGVQKEILSPQQHRIIQAAKFTYSPLGKTFAKQTKTIGGNKLKLYSH